MPQRIQRKRTKGWKMPPNTVYVGRPTEWGNTFKVGNGMSAEEAVMRYRWMVQASEYYRALAYLSLRGKDLAAECAQCSYCTTLDEIEPKGKRYPDTLVLK